MVWRGVGEKDEVWTITLLLEMLFMGCDKYILSISFYVEYTQLLMD